MRVYQGMLDYQHDLIMVMYINKICLKSNGTGVTNNLFQFKIINYMASLSKYSPSSLMHFPILLCHTPIHCWKDSSGMLLSFIVRALLMDSTPSIQFTLIIILCLEEKKKNHTEQDQLNWEVVPLQ